MRILTINEYLDRYCSTNVKYPRSYAEFARHFGKLPQNLGRIMNNKDKWLITTQEASNMFNLYELKNTGCRGLIDESFQ